MTPPHAAPLVDRRRQLRAGWRWARLGELCEFVRGVSFDKADVRTYPSQSFSPILRAGNITEPLELGKDLVWVPDRYVAAEQRLRVGDIAICLSSGSPGVVGKTGQLKHEWLGSVGAFCGIIRPRNDDLADYLSMWFRSPDFVAWRDGQARGANIQNLRLSQFQILEIPLPPLGEQKRIATILKEQMALVDRARSATERQLEAAKALPASYLRAVFDSPDARQWPRQRLGEVCDFLDSRRIPVNHTERSKRIAGKKPSELFPYYGANGQVGWIDGYLFDGPLILLAEDGGNFGSTERPIAYAVSGKYWVNNHAHVLKPRPSVDFDYCLHTIRIRPEVGSLISGSTRAKLNQEVAASIPVPVPPLSEQKRIAAILNEQMAAAEKTRRALEDQFHAINALPVALLRRAFSGEL